MSIPSIISMRIKQVCDTEAEEVQLIEELERCWSGELQVDQLSATARELFHDYEEFMSDMADMAREDDEEYRIGPLDV